MEIVEKVKGLVSNLLRDKEIESVDIVYRREGSKMVLRLVLDKKGGITLDECGAVNERLGELLDKEDVLDEGYILEVCSPGLDRPLKSKKDFDRVAGKLVRVNTYGPVDDKREHVGKVVSCDDKIVEIELKSEGVIRKISLDKISRARLEIEF